LSDPRPHPLEIVDAKLRGAPGVAIRGEIDIAAVPELEHALDVAILESTGAFVLDLSGVEFLDSTGLRLVLRWRALLARDERELAIVCPPGPVRKLFDVAGIAELLFLYDSREAAAAALVPASRPPTATNGG
jgi:anti-sigma B factor antagonist